MAGVHRLKQAVFETPDVGRLAAYYQDIMGLVVASGPSGSVALACPGGDVAVLLLPGSEPRCVALGMETAAAGDADAVSARAARAGLKTGKRSDAYHDAPAVATIASGAGLTIDLFDPAPRTRQGGAAGSAIAPRKLGHLAFNVLDPPSATAFYTDILGFRVSDWMGDFFAFLRCGPDHHTINLLRGKREKMHHIAFEAADWTAIRNACDHLGPRGYPLIWGPGRHGVGHNIFIYHKNPDGQIVELYTEMDQMSDESLGYFDPRPWHEDRPQRPKVWTPGIGASNQWGLPTPDSFRD